MQRDLQAPPFFCFLFLSAERMVGRVIHDMYEESGEDMMLDSFKTTRELKETKEGMRKMREIQRLIYNEGKKEGLEEGKREGKVEGETQGAIEEIKRILNEDYSSEIAQEVFSQTNLAV